MSNLSIEELKILVEQAQHPCVSIYMPTVEAGAETRQNPIRFKNLIRRAEELLEEQGIDRSEALELLQPAMELDQTEFWQHQQAGLALFLTRGFQRFCRLPLPVQELVVVADRFHLKPLLPLFTEDSEFFVLALSQKQVRFFQANRYGISPVEVKGMPQSLDEALNYDETAKEGQFRIATSKGGTANSFVQPGEFHGQGSPDRDQHQKDILQFFQVINDALHPKLRNQTAPLVLVGVEYLLPIYREANTYPHLLDAGVTENPEDLKPEELHEQVWPLVEPQFTQVQEAAVAHYQELSGTGKTSTELKEVVSAAYFGRVDQLIVALDRQQWGSFDPDANQVCLHSDFEPGDGDLLDTAAMQTLLNGGTVYVVEPEQVPDAAPLAAIFRY